MHVLKIQHLRMILINKAGDIFRITVDSTCAQD